MSKNHPSVIVLRGAEPGTVLLIDELLNDFSVGADEGCHLVLSGAPISPMHAALFLDDEGRVTVSDTKSRRGIYVNGTKVIEKALENGDEISIGPPDDPGSGLIRFIAKGAKAPEIVSNEPAPAPEPEAPPLASLDDLLPLPPESEGELSPLDAAPDPALAIDLGLSPLEPEPDPVEDLLPLELPSEPAPESGMDLLGAPPVEETPPAPEPPTAPAAPAAPAKRSPAPPRPTTARPVAKKETSKAAPPADADDPLAGLAESLGGDDSEERFVPPPIVEAAPAVAAAPASNVKKTGTSMAVKVARVAAVAVLVAGLAWFGLQKYSDSIVIPVVDTYLPNPVEPGQTFTINGSGFGSDPDPTIVKVMIGSVEAQVLDASPTRINVTVPESMGSSGSQTLSLKVAAQGTTSTARLVKVTVVPKIAALNPRVAMNGEEVTLSGKWLANDKAKPSVTVGGSDAEVLEATASSVRIRIPEVAAKEGQRLPVKVTVGAETGKEALLNFGRLPFIETIQPARVLPGDTLTLTGLGLSGTSPSVTIGGRPAAVLSATDTEMKISVPGLRLSEGPGERALTVTAGDKTSSTQPIEILRESAALYAPRFFVDMMPDSRIAVACELGPVMILGSDEPSRKRAHDAAARLNGLTTGGRTTRVQFNATDATISAAGGPVLTVAQGDATGSPKVLANVWAASMTDLFDLFLQGRRPGRTIEISPDGKAWVDIFTAARRRSADPGVPQGVLQNADPSWIRSLNALAAGPVLDGSQARILIDGYWAGVIEVPGAIQPRKVEISLTVTPSGLVGQRTSRQGRLSSDVSLQDLTYTRRELRFSFVDSGETLTYEGRLDGESIDGQVLKASGARVGKLNFKLTR